MDDHAVTPDLMKQVAAQCNVVAYLATQLAGVHSDLAKIFTLGGKGPDDIANMVGERTAALMEKLGDILNGMDAITEEDEWTHPVFREAQRLWPASLQSGGE